VRTLGTEASAAWSWVLPFKTGLRTGLTYTFTDARNRSSPGAASYDEPLLYVPRNQMKAHTTLARGPAALDLNIRFTGRRPATSDGTRFLDAYALADAQLRLRHDFGGTRAELAVRVENALDTDYQSIGGRPMPPRHLHVRLFLAL